MITFTLNNYLLLAMLEYASQTDWDVERRPVLCGVLVECSPVGLRLCATDTHTLGWLNLTLAAGHGFELNSPEPLSIVLPVKELKPVLADRKHPAVRFTIDGLRITAENAAGLQLTVDGFPGEEFPNYHHVVPTEPPQPLGWFALDGRLLAKFLNFAKTMKEDPIFDFTLHRNEGPISVRLRSLAYDSGTSFFGIVMPYKSDGPVSIPKWLVPPVSEPERIIRLHNVEGEDLFTGTDDDGLVWSQFVVDTMAEEAPGTCAICSATLQTGWHCIDGGEEICDTHVTLLEDEDDEDVSDELSQSDMPPIPIAEDLPVAIPA